MSTQGIATIDFGALPGTSNASVTITGQAGIASDALVDAWLIPEDGADHLADDYVIDGPEILAGNVVAGTGFTIYAKSRGDGFAYGQWKVGWVWNN